MRFEIEISDNENDIVHQMESDCIDRNQFEMKITKYMIKVGQDLYDLMHLNSKLKITTIYDDLELEDNVYDKNKFFEFLFTLDI